MNCSGDPSAILVMASKGNFYSTSGALIDYYLKILGKSDLKHNHHLLQDEEELSLGLPFAAKVRRVGVLSAVQAAAQSVRDAIVSGKLQPGARLVERDLADALGIGQPTLREALKELEFQGLVRKIPRKGTYVSSFSQEDVRNIMMVRIFLESLAVQLAARNMTPEAELRLRALVDQMFAGADSNNLVGFHDTDVAFHREIWRLAGNEYLLTSLEAIAFRQFVLGVPHHSHERFLAAVKQHREILEGLCTRDPQRAHGTYLSETVNFWKQHGQLDLEGILSTTVVFSQHRSPTEEPGRGPSTPAAKAHSGNKSQIRRDEDGGAPTKWRTEEFQNRE